MAPNNSHRTDTARDKSQIDVQLDALEQLLSSLENSLDSLHSRLHPVLFSPPVPCQGEPAGNNSLSPELCHLAMILSTQAGRVSNLANRVDGIRQSLQL